MNRDDDLNDELRAHLDMAVRDRIARGESPEEAQAAARRELGNELLIKEAARSNWAWLSVERLARDARYALRQIRHNPGFAAITILTMGLGLGAATTMYSLLDGVLLRPLQYKDPENLYMGREIFPGRPEGNREVPVNARHFYEWRAHCTSCDAVAMADGIGFTINGENESVRLPGLRVSSNFFSTLGVQPALGRDFLPEEELPGKHRVLLLADALWRTRFQEDPNIVGRDIRIDGEPYVIVGVLPASFSLPRGDQWTPGFPHNAQPLLFRPLGFDVAAAEPVGMHNYASVVRLRPGIAIAQGRTEMDALIQPMAKQNNFPVNAELVPMHQAVTEQAQSSLWLLLGIVAAVLLIVCVNTGNLMLVRTARRAREAGIRLALGADRGQIFALVLTEAFLLVSAGAVLGWLLAKSAVSALIAAAPAGIPRIEEVQMDMRVLLFACAAAAITTLLCGLLPALQLAKAQPRETIQSGTHQATDSRGRLRLREWLVGAEVALSAVLLIFGGLLTVSFLRLLRVDKGFETGHVFTQGISLTSPAYREPRAPRNYLDAVLPRIAAIPGVRSSGATSHIPLRGETWIDSLVDVDAPPKRPGEAPGANIRFVSPGYLETMGIQLKQGRYFEERDRNRPVAVISGAAARLLWPDRDPIGRHIEGSGTERPDGGVEVIGVVADVRAGLDREAPLTVYQPSWTFDHRGWSFVVRTHGDPKGVISGVREAIRSYDPSVPLMPAQTMDDVLDESIAARRYQTYLVAGFAAVALMLASMGIFGVVSFTVARRTQEIGVRIALGAQTSSVVRMVIAQGMRPVVFGLLVGVPVALALAQFIASQLFQVSPRDPWTITTVAAVLLFASVFACWLPARRAARIDPVVALRAD